MKGMFAYMHGHIVNVQKHFICPKDLRVSRHVLCTLSHSFQHSLINATVIPDLLPVKRSSLLFDTVLLTVNSFI